MFSAVRHKHFKTGFSIALHYGTLISTVMCILVFKIEAVFGVKNK